MIGTPETDTLAAAQISAVIYRGLYVTDRTGRPARLAIIDEDGKVIEAGPAVAKEVWNVAIGSYRNFLAGNGHLRVFSGPAPGVGSGSTAAA